MKITRFHEIEPGKQHPGQTGMCGFPLQKTEQYFVGMSQYVPRGGVPETSPNAKANSIITYFILSGEMALNCGDHYETLEKYDSVALDIGDSNMLVNLKNEVAEVLVIIGGVDAGPK